MTVIEWVTLTASGLVCVFFGWRYEKLKQENIELLVRAAQERIKAEHWEERAAYWKEQATWFENRSAPAPSNGKAPVIHDDIDPGFGLDVLEDGTVDLPEKVPPKKLC